MQARISADRLRRFTYTNKLAKRVGRKWVMTDERPRRVPTLTRGQVKTVTVPGFNGELLSNLVYAEEIKRRPGWVVRSLLR